MTAQSLNNLRGDTGSWYPKAIRKDNQKGQNPMSDQKVTTGNHALQPANGMQRRCFPDLQLEIGADQADILLQIDHWIANLSENGWIEMSAKQMQYAFPAWSRKKIQREIITLARRGFILLANRCHPKNSKTPLIALNYERLSKLSSLAIKLNPSKIGSDNLKLSEPIISGH